MKGTDKAVHIWSCALFSAVLMLDQATKYLVRIRLSINGYRSIIPGFLNLVYVLNRGGAFGICSSLSPLLRWIIFIIFSLVAIMALAVLYRKSSHTPVTRFGIAFLMGGAVGNLIDRLRWGVVVDFIDFYIGHYHWPAFNVADTAICIGLGLVLLELIIIKKQGTV